MTSISKWQVSSGQSVGRKRNARVNMAQCWKWYKVRGRLLVHNSIWMYGRVRGIANDALEHFYRNFFFSINFHLIHTENRRSAKEVESNRFLFQISKVQENGKIRKQTLLFRLNLVFCEHFHKISIFWVFFFNGKFTHFRSDCNIFSCASLRNRSISLITF